MNSGGGASKRRAYKVLILIACVAASALTNCFSPVGSIGGSDSSDLFWAVPNRVAYNLYEMLLRNDMQVFTSYKGVVQSIPVDMVEIGIAEDPDMPESLEPFLPDAIGYSLDSSGRKLVVVKYGNLTPAMYSIEVRDPYNLGGGGGTGPGEGPGILIEWEVPVKIPKQ